MTVSAELSDKPNRLGLFSVRIRITIDCKHKRLSIGVTVKDADWNNLRKEVRKTDKLHEEKNQIICGKIEEINKIFFKIRPKTAEGLALAYEQGLRFDGENKSNSFLGFMESIAVDMKAGMKARYFVVRNKLWDFNGKKPIYFEDICHEFIEKFQFWLENEIKNNDNTVTSNIKIMQGAYRKAQLRGKVAKGFNPFADIKKKKNKVIRTRLNDAEILVLENNEFLENSPHKIAVDFFLFCYYAHGMRVGDALLIKPMNVKGLRLDYVMMKTKTQKSILIHEKMAKIINKYINEAKVINTYLFPFMRKIKEFNNEEHRLKEIKNKTAYVNSLLKEIEIILRFQHHLSSHVNRHTFADKARKSNDVYVVSQALGHSSIVITQAYFGDAKDAELDNINKMY